MGISGRIFLIVFLLFITSKLNAQLIHYDVVDNDPYHIKNLNLSFGLLGFNADKTNLQVVQNIQLHLYTKPLSVELKYNLPELYYLKQTENKYRDKQGIIGFRPTHTPYEATLILNLKRKSVRYETRLNLRSLQTYYAGYVFTDTKFIMIPATRLHVKGLRIGAQEMYSTSQYIRRLGANDSVITYHPYHTYTVYLGFDYKEITNHYIKVPSYGRESSVRKVVNYFADIMYSPMITIDPDNKSIEDEVEERPIGWRIGMQYLPSTTLGIYFRTELGTHPGVYWKGNLFFNLALGLNFSMRTYSNKRY